MRFISKLAMTATAIFFALSVSAHAGGHDTTSNSLGSKIYQVCKKWRVDQGGWLPTEDMQHCRNVLYCASVDSCRLGRGQVCDSLHCIQDPGSYGSEGNGSVDRNARTAAKVCLQNKGDGC